MEIVKIKKNKRFIAEYSLYGDRYDVICEGDTFQNVLCCLMRTYKYVKNCRCADFRIRDTRTGLETHMELGENGVSIFSNLGGKKGPRGSVYDFEPVKGVGKC